MPVPTMGAYTQQDGGTGGPATAIPAHHFPRTPKNGFQPPEVPPPSPKKIWSCSGDLRGDGVILTATGESQPGPKDPHKQLMMMPAMERAERRPREPCNYARRAGTRQVFLKPERLVPKCRLRSGHKGKQTLPGAERVGPKVPRSVARVGSYFFPFYPGKGCNI